MPSDKRARQRAGRQARQEQLRQGQVRRRRRRQLLFVVAPAVAVAIALIVVLSLVNSGGSSTTTTVKKASATDCAGTPAPSAPTTTVPAKPPAVAVIDAPAGVGFPKLDGSSPHYTHFSVAPPFCIDPAKTYTATMVTDVGTITVKLDQKAAPRTVNNFVFLAGYHYFDGTVFHRVIPGFVDQGGDPTGTGSGGPGYQFADELPKSNAVYTAGALAMANSGPNTNGSQFFIVVDGGGKQLQPSYTYFGQVTSGLDVANKINADGDASDNGSPPKVTHHIVSVSITAS
ncbi:MAG TPA: peptidylprolyl isomerase [Acidimicrobiales bacterium]|nr:peptidylprolyl isomerase [Acidimicrobiales bacterium]